MPSANRFRLITLGRLTLVGPSGDEDAHLAKRRHKLALLTVVAMARGPVARDDLLAMFWPGQDNARARHSLSNALSALRRTLGPEAIVSRQATVALSSDAPLSVDAVDLAEAVSARDGAQVVSLYQGSFLDGTRIDGTPAFDHWLSRERRRIDRLFVEACTQQCSALARSRQWNACRSLATRWLDVEPLSPDAALFLLNAIKAPATPAALDSMLDEYERLRLRLARDYDRVPDAVVRELAGRIRDQLVTMPTPARPVVITQDHREVRATSEPAPVASSAMAGILQRLRGLAGLTGTAFAMAMSALGAVGTITARPANADGEPG